MCIRDRLDIGASTEKSSENIFKLSQSNDIDMCIQDLDIHPNIKEFLHFTFSIIREGKPHKIAAIFTFGRENLIPNMFNEILHEFEKNIKGSNIGKLIYYFERHIELDEDEHGPMALDMVSKLAGDKAEFWLEIEEISKIALQKRILLWDAIEDLLESNSSWSDLRNSKHETYSHSFSEK